MTTKTSNHNSKVQTIETISDLVAGTTVDDPSVQRVYSIENYTAVIDDSVSPHNALHPKPYSRSGSRTTPVDCAYWAEDKLLPSIWRKGFVRGNVAMDSTQVSISFPGTTASLQKARASYANNLIAAKAQALVFAKEWRQTSNLLSKSSKGLLTGLIQFASHANAQALRKDFRKLVRKYDSGELLKLKSVDEFRTRGLTKQMSRDITAFHKNVTGNYLEFQFGVRPLLADIAHAREVFDKGAKYRVKVTGASTDTQNEQSWDAKTVLPYALYQAVFWTRCRAERFTCYKLGSVVLVDVDEVSQLEQLGLSWESVLPSLWEIIPYSFVVDYFSNVNEIVNAIAASTIKTGGLYQSSFNRTRYVFASIRAPKNPNSRYKQGGDASDGLYEVYNFQRVTTGIALIPTFELQVPGVEQSVNTMALVLNKVSSHSMRSSSSFLKP